MSNKDGGVLVYLLGAAIVAALSMPLSLIEDAILEPALINYANQELESWMDGFARAIQTNGYSVECQQENQKVVAWVTVQLQKTSFKVGYRFHLEIRDSGWTVTVIEYIPPPQPQQPAGGATRRLSLTTQ